MNDAPNILEFWGKARPMGEGPPWHPLVLHALDVASVGEAILRSHEALRGRLGQTWGLSEESVFPTLRFLLCLHDVGKFAKKFQAKAPEHFPSCFAGDAANVATSFDHGAGGLHLFDADPANLAMADAEDPFAWRLMVSAVTGHHGRPPPPRAGNVRRDFARAGVVAARQFAREARGLCLGAAALPRIDESHAERASFLVAGLAVLADWIGSNQEWFPYREARGALDAHWSEACGRAATAVAEAGVLPCPARERVAYRDLLPDLRPDVSFERTPMQQWAEQVALPEGPALFFVEDETGSGKTEAAVMLAHRLMCAGAAGGLYVALPTMATANAMFDRLARSYRCLFADDAEPSVALAHGARGMHEDFQEARLRGGRHEEPYSGSSAGESDDTTASAACAEWIADDRRRTFLADVGVGTIDQALLGVLPSRHQSLRLLGIAQRVLVLDEVHAYDRYMQREMEGLLEFQAALGGSAILLSATLPLRMRGRLAAAFGRGLPGGLEDPDDTNDYPLATTRCRRRIAAEAVPGVAARARAVPVRFLRHPLEAIDRIERAARDGRAALYIRNTVDDALDAHAELGRRGVDADLFHSRFALVDRLDIERRVTDTFGRMSAEAERRGKVLVATQVVEQSLDLDFDVLATDLAPVDLVIQRMGRLWRHERPHRRGRPELLVVGPEPVDDAGPDWFRRAFPGAAHVYWDHARMWLTARRLEDAGMIDSPGGLRQLIESVYGEGVDSDVPEGLQDIYWDAEGRANADASVAAHNVLDVRKGYRWDGAAWESDIRTPTRLDDDPGTTLRLGCLRNGRIVPYAAAATATEWRAWRLSEVRVPARRAAGETTRPAEAAAADAAKAAWGRFEKDYVLVVLRTDEDRILGGMVTDGRGEGAGLTYDPGMGLRWV